jgi:hypothetical protein
MIQCSIRSRQQEGSCNSCQRRDQEIVILVELNTVAFRVCNRCAKELSEKMTALLSPSKENPSPESDDSPMEPDRLADLPDVIDKPSVDRLSAFSHVVDLSDSIHFDEERP